MMAFLGTLVIALVVWLVVCGFTSIAASLAWRAIAGRMAHAHPQDRSRFAALVAVSPLVLPSAVLLACLAPGLVDVLGGPADHCLAHPDHLHLCLAHPRFVIGADVGLTAAIAALVLTLRARRPLRDWKQAHARSKRLRMAPARAVAPDAREIELAAPFCFTSGFLRPSIWVSRGLWLALSERERAVVLAHERAHVRRRDPLLRAAASLGTILMPSATRRDLLGELHAASEHACDEAAALAVRDRVSVAEALVRVERLCSGLTADRRIPIEVAFGGSGLTERVARLLEPARTAPPHLLGWRVAAVVCAVAFGFELLPLHHWVEHALEILPRLH